MVSTAVRSAAPASSSARRTSASVAPSGATLSASESSYRTKSWNTAALRAPAKPPVELSETQRADPDGGLGVDDEMVEVERPGYCTVRQGAEHRRVARADHQKTQRESPLP